jgi:AP2 domain
MSDLAAERVRELLSYNAETGVFTWRVEWRSRITVRGRHIYLGKYCSPEEAHAAYCAAAKDLHGKHARLA